MLNAVLRKTKVFFIKKTFIIKRLNSSKIFELSERFNNSLNTSVLSNNVKNDSTIQINRICNKNSDNNNYIHKNIKEMDLKTSNKLSEFGLNTTTKNNLKLNNQSIEKNKNFKILKQDSKCE